MGMVPYADEPSPPTLPWPYAEMKQGDERCPPATHWFKFTQSDSYCRDLEDLETIKASGDANALAMFVAHHPFVVEALLQLSIVLYQTSQRQEGLSILKRSLWVFECAALNSFLKTEGRVGFLDYDLPENAPFFEALFRLMRVSAVAGLSRTALAASRFLLSLDPLRDPMNVLLAIDYFAMQSNTESCNEWFVDFVESDTVSAREWSLATNNCYLLFSPFISCVFDRFVSHIETKTISMALSVAFSTFQTFRIRMPSPCSVHTTRIHPMKQKKRQTKPFKQQCSDSQRSSAICSLATM